VNANVTTFTVLVNNSATVPVNLNAIGLHGNFTVLGSLCLTFGGWTPYQSPPGSGPGHDPSNHKGPAFCIIPMHFDELVFVPTMPSSTSASTTTTSTTTTTSATKGTCSTGQLSLVNGQDVGSFFRGLTLNAGQCVYLTFSGKISFGNSNFVLVPSTSSGQVYVLQVVGSAGSNQLVACTLPLGAGSCKPLQPQPDSHDW
jgi:hypothetical protein